MKYLSSKILFVQSINFLIIFFAQLTCKSFSKLPVDVNSVIKTNVEIGEYLQDYIEESDFLIMAFGIPEIDSMFKDKAFEDRFRIRLSKGVNIYPFTPKDTVEKAIDQQAQNFFLSELRRYMLAGKISNPNLKKLINSLPEEITPLVNTEHFFILLRRMYKADGIEPWEISSRLFDALIISEGDIIRNPSKDYMTDKMYKKWMEKMDWYEFVANESTPLEVIKRKRAFLIIRMKKQFKNKWEKIAYNAIVNAEIREVN